MLLSLMRIALVLLTVTKSATVSVPAWLVTWPATLLTTHQNWLPESQD